HDSHDLFIEAQWRLWERDDEKAVLSGTEWAPGSAVGLEALGWVAFGQILACAGIKLLNLAHSLKRRKTVRSLRSSSRQPSRNRTAATGNGSPPLSSGPPRRTSARPASPPGHEANVPPSAAGSSPRPGIRRDTIPRIPRCSLPDLRRRSLSPDRRLCA